MMTDDELKEIEERASKATGGPWKFRHKEMNDKMHEKAKRMGGKVRQKDLWLWLLCGPYRGPSDSPTFKEWSDAWDYPHIFHLEWRELKHKEKCGSMTVEDQDFIAHAREDVPKLIQEVRRLKEPLALCLSEMRGVEKRHAEIAANKEYGWLDTFEDD